MGMDLLVGAVAWHKDTPLDAEPGRVWIDLAPIQKLDPDGDYITAGVVSESEFRERLKQDLELLVSEARGVRDRRDVMVLYFGEWRILLTGGGSWGDSPTEFFDILQDLPWEALRRAGFDWPDERT